MDNKLRNAQFLFEKGADVELGIERHETPLIIATHKSYHNIYDRDDRYDICRLLLENRTSVHFQGPDGGTPLLYALASWGLRVVHLLLAYGAEIRAVNANNATALHFAARNSDVNVIQFVLDQGIVDVNCRADHGFTALHQAAQCGNFSVCEYLLRRGAVVDSKSKELWFFHW